MGNDSFDEARSEAFAEKMVCTLNSGALTLMLSIGHRAGLFDAMAGLIPSTSAEIAGAAGLNERYVREWLGAMVTGGIVECDPDGPRYSLPSEHAAFLTRSGENIAVFAQYIPLLGAVEDKILKCFYEGGGVPYTEYSRFHEVMAEDSGQTVVAALIEHILPLAPGLTEALEGGIDVMDVGCGSGRALNLMAERFPRSRFTGFDLSKEALDAGRAEAEARGIANVTFLEKDLTEMEAVPAYDLITAFDAIHDQASPEKVLSGIAGALKPDGTFLMQDIGASSHVHKNLDHPVGPLLYTLSCMHCMSVSLAQGGPGLGAMWGEELAGKMLTDAGFTQVEVKKLPHDFQNYYYIVSKG